MTPEPYQGGKPKARRKFRMNFNKPFYRRLWFWTWAAIVITDIVLVVGAIMQVYNNPCTVNYGTVVCADSTGERIGAALVGGFVSSVFVFFANLCPLGLWAVWTFVIKRNLRMEQEKMDAQAAAMTESDQPPATN